MKVRGTVKQDVEVDPRDVIQGLLDLALEENEYVRNSMSGRFYRVLDMSCTDRGHEIEISGNLYDYIKALDTVKDNL